MTEKQYYYKCIDYRLNQLANDLTLFTSSLSNNNFIDTIIELHSLLIDHYRKNKCHNWKTPSAFRGFENAFNRICKLCEIENFIENYDNYYDYKNSIKKFLFDLTFVSCLTVELETPFFLKLFTKKNFYRDSSNKIH